MLQTSINNNSIVETVMQEIAFAGMNYNVNTNGNVCTSRAANVMLHQLLSFSF